MEPYLYKKMTLDLMCDTVISAEPSTLDNFRLKVY